MKTIICLYKKLFFLAWAFVVTTAHSQGDKSSSIKSMIETKRFVFKVQSVLPTSMPMRQLTGDDYYVHLFGDSLVSYLPYFGRSYTAPLPGAPGGYNFTSKDFEYTGKNKKKGGWDVVIKPKDVKDLREFNLTVSENGYASLRALSNNRQLITYNGYLAEARN